MPAALPSQSPVNWQARATVTSKKRRGASAPPGSLQTWLRTSPWGTLGAATTGASPAGRTSTGRPRPTVSRCAEARSLVKMVGDVRAGTDGGR